MTDEPASSSDSSPQTAHDACHDGGLDLEPLWQLVEGGSLGCSTDPLIGQTVGDVLVVRLIAEGGMGRVYEGLQQRLGRAVALKILRPGLVARSAIRRFLRETEILAQLRHPGISQVYSAGIFDVAGSQLPFFVMELVPSALPITEFVRRHVLPPCDLAELFCQVCDAVAHAHAIGVVHRDLKPSNILIDANGRPKVIDFGIAWDDRDHRDPIAMTVTGQMLGTLQYMSPEQVHGTRTIEPSSDVYSLGVILHELVIGSLPYDLAREPLVEAARMIQERPPPVDPLAAARYPAGIGQVIETSLRKNPRQRYRDAAAMAAAVRSLPTRPPRRPSVSSWMMPSRFRPGRRLPGSILVASGLLLAGGIGLVFRQPLSGWRKSVAAGSLSAPANVATAQFRYAFTDVLDPEADRFLVEAFGMIKWNDPREDPRVTYWGPSEDGVEGRLVYRVRFPGPTTAIRIMTHCQCWDFLKHPGGVGRGVSALEASQDGVDWITLRDHITHRDWGVSWEARNELPASLVGTDELWLRLRFLTEAADTRSPSLHDPSPAAMSRLSWSKQNMCRIPTLEIEPPRGRTNLGIKHG